jgi:hypothetical protein
MPTIRALTHLLRDRLEEAGSPLSLGHTHQLLAAARGYTSLAILQSANEPDELDRQMHWIIDLPQVHERAASLGLTIDTEVFVSSLAQASRDCSGLQIHSSDADMAEEFIEAAKEITYDDSWVAGEMANTNCTGPWETQLEFSGSSIDTPAKVGEFFQIDYEGQVEGDPDLERPYSGHSVDVSLKASFRIIGRRLFAGPPKIEILGASLDDGYYGEDATEIPKSWSQLEAIAIELEIPVDAHEQLEGAEIDVHTTSADNAVGYLVNIKNCAASPIIDRLRHEHPTQQIWVLGSTFDQINRFD